MNYDHVFQKTALGREEIKSQAQGILPREARTLLIMIDGKRDYKSYLDTLDQSKMFAGFGGVTPIFELLLELDYIDIVGGAKTTSQTSIVSDSQPLSPQPVDFQLINSQPVASSPNINTETEFDRTFNDNSPSKAAGMGKSSIGNMFKSKLSRNNYETIKSDLAIFIEKNAPSVEAWGYLLMLEQCENSRHLLTLVQEIQNTSHGDLGRGMNTFIKRIQY
ncbi:hypothetical protein AAJP47_02415 [Psychrobacter sp. B38]|uniref:hypothetical protein n=1 Tax=Psychrobacter sp. B38 TaxID=3143538 RepID=UPI003210F445